MPKVIPLKGLSQGNQAREGKASPGGSDTDLVFGASILEGDQLVTLAPHAQRRKVF